MIKVCQRCHVAFESVIGEPYCDECVPADTLGEILNYDD